MRPPSVTSPDPPLDSTPCRPDKGVTQGKLRYDPTERIAIGFRCAVLRSAGRSFLIKTPQPPFPAFRQAENYLVLVRLRTLLRWRNRRGESLSTVSVLLFSRGNGRAFSADSGRVATCTHMPWRYRSLRDGVAPEDAVTTWLRARSHATRPGRGSLICGGSDRLLWDSSEGYSWNGSTRDYHLAQIRQHTGCRYPTARDKDELETWHRTQGAMDAHTADALFDAAGERLRQQRVELPAETKPRCSSMRFVPRKTR